MDSSIFKHLPLFRILLAAGADTEAADSYDNTVLHYLARNGHTDSIKLLPDIKVVGFNGYTALHYAAMNGHVNTVEYLLDSGIAVDVVNRSERETALHCAADRNQLEVAKLLLKRGADINARDAVGKTALHCAARKNNVDMITMLLDNSANIDVVDDQGNTVLHDAINCHQANAVSILIDKGAGVYIANKEGTTPLFYAWKHYSYEIVELMEEAILSR